MRPLLVALVAVWSGCSGANVAAPPGSAADASSSRAPAVAAADEPLPTGAAFATIAPADEPGAPMLVTGRVFAPDGTTPRSGVTVYVYHADAEGRYAPPSAATPSGATPRLRAWLVTDRDGRYGYRTVRPAPYPGGRFPAHVHTQLWGDDAPPQYGTELLFADDALVSAEDVTSSAALGRFAFVRPATRGADGVLRVTHDLRSKERGDTFEDSTAHGWRDRPR